MKKASSRPTDILHTWAVPMKKDRRLLVLFVFALILLFKYNPFASLQREERKTNTYYVTNNIVLACTKATNQSCDKKLPDSRPFVSTSSADGIAPGFAFFFNKPFAINRATVSDLTLLPGIGPRTAEKIYAYRLQHGNIKTADELMNINGIGVKTVQKIKPFIDVSL